MRIKQGLILLFILSIFANSAQAEVSINFSPSKRNFFAGEKITQKIILINTEDKEKEGVLQWKTLLNQAIIQKEEKKITLLPQEEKNIELKLDFPDVKRKVSLLCKVQFSSQGKVEDEKETNFFLFPKVNFGKLQKLFEKEKLGIFGLDGKLKEIFEGIPFKELDSDLSIQFFKGKTIIFFAADISQQKRRLSLLQQKAKEGGTVILLEKGNQEIKQADVLEPVHPLFFGLQKENFENWQVKLSFYPFSFPTTNFSILLSADNKPLLLEQFLGKGRIIFYSLNLEDGLEPLSQHLLFNILSYSLMPSPEFQPVAFFAPYIDEITQIFYALNVDYFLNPANFDSFSTLIIHDGGQFSQKNEDFFYRLKRFLQKRGKVIILNPQPQTILLFKSIASASFISIDSLYSHIPAIKEGKITFLQLPLKKEEDIFTLIQILTNLGIKVGNK